MRRARFSIVLVGVASLTTCAVGAPAVGAQPAHEKHPPAALYGVSATSANDVWAAGGYNSDFGWGELASHWTGTHWAGHSSPGPGGRSFGENTAISVDGPQDIWVAGNSGDPDAGPARFISHRTHDGWHLVRIAYTTDHWLSISAVSGVGAFALGTQGADDRVWSEVHGVRHHVEVDAGMKSISMSSGTDGWIVGGAGSAHFDGHSWTDVSVAGAHPRLVSVSAAGTDAWAVGRQRSGKLVEQAVGGVWSVMRLPEALRAGSLVSVSATGTDNVWALGTDGSGASVAIHWDGTAWQQTTLDETGFTKMRPESIVGVPGAVWAVGKTSDGAFREYWDGAAWHIT